MRVTENTRRILAARRENRDLTAQGYRRHETDWEIHRGFMACKDYRILDARVSVDGLYVYTKVGRTTTDKEETR